MIPNPLLVKNTPMGIFKRMWIKGMKKLEIPLRDLPAMPVDLGWSVI